MSHEISLETKEMAKRMCTIDIIFPPQNLFYYYSILYSAECSVRAFDSYEYLLEQKEFDPILLISLIQEAIGHAGSLAFYFWNNGHSSRKPTEVKDYIKHRSNCFLKEFNLNDNSSLKNRALRNMFEHFDEKVDIFLINNLSGTFYPMPTIGKHTDIENNRLNKHFKLLDIEEKCLVLLNEKFFFEEIQKEVIEIYKIAKEKVDKKGMI